MKRLIVRVLVALLALAAGLLSAKLWPAYRSPLPQTATVEPEVGREAEQPAEPITFENTGIVDLFKVTYRSSDGESVRYGCFKRSSSSRAIEGLPKASDVTRIVERGPVWDEKGVRVGERVVSVTSPGPYTSVSIEWTEGAKAFEIVSSSLEHALAFEKSKAWEGQGCSYFK